MRLIYMTKIYEFIREGSIKETVEKNINSLRMSEYKS